MRNSPFDEKRITALQWAWIGGGFWLTVALATSLIWLLR